MHRVARGNANFSSFNIAAATPKAPMDAAKGPAPTSSVVGAATWTKRTSGTAPRAAAGP